MPDNLSSSPQKVVVSDRAVGRLRGGHVWVYSSDVLDTGSARPGDLVRVVSTRGRLLGSAIYSSSSQIKLRLIAREEVSSEEEFLQVVRRRLSEAVAYRGQMVQNSDAYRLVFSEGDRLPGMIIDRYNDVYTFQVLTQAWDRPDRRNAVIAALQEFTGAENIAERVDERIRDLENLPDLAPGMLSGAQSSTVFTMNGVRFHYDSQGGQKTGAFLDQRENYAAAAALAHGQALDVCTYQGGFALHLSRVCDHVTALDSSREALEVAEQNEKLNAAAGRNEIEWIEANAFDLLRDYADAGRQYDMIVLDPPAFAKSKKNLATAMRGYKELNLRALKMLRSGGILVTCSCSFAVSEEDFRAMLTEAAQDAHRSVRIVEKRTQSKDHPIVLGVPETFYLKCIILSIN
ncbi:MAG TPA: class I SAM-dependent rRNA methyltransferase [Candidatus Limnocylindrales bacterium]|nr:class I SAM-dependent rRNA methyltransferase [Candidatus Limnocylindrales bacterium]